MLFSKFFWSKLSLKTEKKNRYLALAFYMKCEIGKCNDSKEMYKSEVHMQSCCFANLIPIFFFSRSRCRRLSSQNTYRETIQRKFTFMSVKKKWYFFKAVFIKIIDLWSREERLINKFIYNIVHKGRPRWRFDVYR